MNFIMVENMTLDELQAKWKIDCIIDEDNIGHAAAISPNLHSFYLGELIQWKLKAVKNVNEIQVLKTLKARYYRGEMSKEELDSLNLAQWQYKTLKADIENLVCADEEVQKLGTREVYIKTVIYFLESVLSEIKARSFHCKTCLDWIKYRSGA